MEAVWTQLNTFQAFLPFLPIMRLLKMVLPFQSKSKSYRMMSQTERTHDTTGGRTQFSQSEVRKEIAHYIGT